MKGQRFNSIRTRDDSEWRVRGEKARARRRALGLPDPPLDWNAILAERANRRRKEISQPTKVDELWKKQIRQKYSFVTTIRVQIVRSGLELIALGRKLEEALPTIDYNKKQTATLGHEEAGIETHELKIALPEKAGKVDIKITPAPGANVTVTPHIIRAGSEHVIVGYYKKGEEEFPTDYDIPNHKSESFSLKVGQYHIFIEWEGSRWEIPFEVQ